MLYGLANARLIVDSNIADAAFSWSDVHKDQRHFSEAQVGNHILFHAERKYCHPIHPTIDHASYRTFHPFRVRTGGAEKNLVIVLDSDLLERLDYLREEWVRDLRNNQS